MENLNSGIQPPPSDFIDKEGIDYLSETAKWTKFLSIMGFVGIGIMVVVSFIMIIIGAFLSPFAFGMINPSLLFIIYLVMAGVYFFPVYYLYEFSTGIKKGIASNNQALINKGLRNLKSHYKFMGIFTIVIISLYVVMFFISIIIMSVAKMWHF